MTLLVKPIQTQKQTRPYLPPQLLAELELETRAGSPVLIPDDLPPALMPDNPSPAERDPLSRPTGRRGK